MTFPTSNSVFSCRFAGRNLALAAETTNLWSRDRGLDADGQGVRRDHRRRHLLDRNVAANVGLTPCFVSDLSDGIEQHRPALWIHGRTDDSFDYRVGRTRIVCDPWLWPDAAGEAAGELGVRRREGRRGLMRRNGGLL